MATHGNTGRGDNRDADLAMATQEGETFDDADLAKATHGNTGRGDNREADLAMLTQEGDTIVKPP